MSTLTDHDRSRWFVTRRGAERARLRLFCLPFAGGSARSYHEWQAALGRDVEVCAVRLPGRESRIAEPAFGAVDPLVEVLAEAISDRIDLPYVIFGHSMGALIGFELVRRLRRQGGRGPRHLIVSGRSAPQLPDPEPPKHGLPQDEFVAELRRLEGTPPEVLDNPDLLELMLPLLRADFALCETYRYRPEPPLDCPISVYGGLTDGTIDRPMLEAWRAQTTGPFVVRMFAGGHFFIHSARGQILEILLREIFPHLDAVVS